MKEVAKKVRHKGKVVSEVNVPVYDTVDEILNSEPSERIVAVFNNGNHVRIMGNERAKFSGTKTGKKKRLQLAFNCLSVDELMSCAQDSGKLNQLLESDEVQARVDAMLAESGETVEEADAEEEEAVE